MFTKMTGVTRGHAVKLVRKRVRLDGAHHGGGVGWGNNNNIISL